MDLTRFVDTKLIDGHVHVRGLDANGEMLEWMDQAGLTSANLVSTPSLQTVNQNAELIYLKLQYSGRFYGSGGLDYVQAMADPARTPGALQAQVHRLRRIGFDGLKLIEGKPTARKRFQMPLDGPEYEAMWSALEELEMPIVCHVADPEEFWDRASVPDWAVTRGWFYGDGSYPPKEALYAEIDRVLARHPRLRLILAHFYFLSADLGRAARLLDAYPDVCLDITPGGEMYNHFTRNRTAARAFFVRYQDRIIYGTDVSTGAVRRGGLEMALSYGNFVRTFLETRKPFVPPPTIPHWLEPDLDAIQPIDLPRSVLDKIYHSNFTRLFGASPARVNRSAAYEELERLAAETDALAGAGAGNLARDVISRLG